MKSSSKLNSKVRWIPVAVLAVVFMMLLTGLSAGTSPYPSANHRALLELTGGPALQRDGAPTPSGASQTMGCTSLASAPIAVASVMWGSLVKRDEPRDPRIRGRSQGWPSGVLTQLIALGHQATHKMA